MLSLEQLIAPLAPESIKSTYYNVLSRIGVNVTSWKPGNPIRTMIAAASVWQSSFTYWASNAVKSRFLLLSRGDWLKANAKYDYGTDYHESTFATGPIMLTNTSANVYDFDIGDLTVSYLTLLSDGITPITYSYTNTAAVHVPDGSGVPVSQAVVIEAAIEGSVASIPTGATVTLLPSYPGLSVTVAVAVNGVDEEPDQDLIVRCQLAASAISPNGPTDAYRYVAISTLVAGAPVCTRVSVAPGNPLTVYLGNASGGLTGTELAAVTLELQTKVVPLGVIANIVSGASKTIHLGWGVWCRKETTLSTATIVADVNAALAAFMASFPMGGNPVALVNSEHAAGTRWMYYDALKSVIEGTYANTLGVENPIYHVEVATTSWGEYDIPFSVGEIAVLGTITANVVTFA